MKVFICFLLLQINAFTFAQSLQIEPPGIEKELNNSFNIKKDRDSGHVYRMNYWRSVAFSGAATAANIYAIPNLIKAKKPLTDAELQSLNRNIINKFDKWALEQDPSKRGKIDITSDRLLSLTSVAAVGLLLDKKIRKDWLRILTLFYETNSVTFSLYNFSPLGPLFQNRIRPVAYYDYFSDEVRKEGNSRNSFYSGHVANAAASSFFIAKVYSDYHPELGNKKYWVYGLAAVPPLVIGYLRVKALYHFPSDGLVGMAIGAACGIIVPETHRIKRWQNVTIAPASNGAGLSLTWKIDKKRMQLDNRAIEYGN